MARHESLKVLLEQAGIDIDRPNNRGRTPLHLAALWNGNPAIVRFLLEQGADEDVRDRFDATPLNLLERNGELSRKSKAALLELLQ